MTVVDTYYNTGSVANCIAFERSEEDQVCTFSEPKHETVKTRGKCEELCVNNDCRCYNYKEEGFHNCEFSPAVPLEVTKRVGSGFFSFSRNTCGVSIREMYTAVDNLRLNETSLQFEPGVVELVEDIELAEDCKHACSDRPESECKAWTFFKAEFWLQEYALKCFLVQEAMFQELDYTGSSDTVAGIHTCPTEKAIIREDDLVSTGGGKGLLVVIIICVMLLIFFGLWYFWKNFKRDIFGFEELEMNDFPGRISRGL
jgi:hypothetical protein